MVLKTMVIDDDALSRNFLERFCTKNDDIELIGVYENAVKALEFLDNNQVDLLFLDVEMPDLSGFQLLDELIKKPRIILTTSKTDYAFDAFQYGVNDYLKKPISFTRFKDAIDKIKLTMNQQADVSKADVNEEIFIKSDGKLTRLNCGDILYIESIGDYVKFITSSRSYVSLGPLKSIEQRIDNRFMKVHRSYIVNSHKIKDIQDNSVVIDGKVIPISKSHKSDVLSRIKVI